MTQQNMMLHPVYGWIPANAGAAYGQAHGQAQNQGYGSPPNAPQQPWPPGPDARPDLNVQTYQSLAARPGMSWSIESVADPRPLIPVSHDGDVAMIFRTRVARFSGLAAGQSTQSTLQFDTPTAVYARCGGWRTADDSTPAASYSSPLNLFDVRFTRASSSTNLDIDQGMGGVLLGTAERPSYCGGRAWQFDNGNSLTITFTPIIAQLVVDISIFTIQFPGPDNYIAAGGSR